MTKFLLLLLLAVILTIIVWELSVRLTARMIEWKYNWHMTECLRQSRLVHPTRRLLLYFVIIYGVLILIFQF